MSAPWDDLVSKTVALRWTAILRDGSVRKHKPFPAPLLEEGRPPAMWQRMFYEGAFMGAPGGHETVCAALGLSMDTEDDFAPRLCLNVFGVTASKVVPERKQWRLPTSKENSIDAVIVPIGACASFQMPGLTGTCLALLGEHELAREATAWDVCDLVAIPLDSSPVLSLNGTTSAIGTFQPDGRGDVRLRTSGIGWLKQHIVRSRAMAPTVPLEQLARKVEFPDRMETLVLDAKAFSWRLERGGWIAQAGLRRLICDSADLAEFIGSELRKREKLPPGPKVLGPRRFHDALVVGPAPSDRIHDDCDEAQ